ncbi:uncharacterized protein LOC105190506 isoform X2 [Harpegnathos saltator]|uniref:Chitin-binding type-2 domain-containing protein n=1 Tax=Harpegnathos saltator TaxID=610380 RepID=E2C6E0_HARSA|nr:uncharacterized protein LOC105190506 isoform X2 [Harpegnathos saltator]EFN76494.1 hypothetical protein EAI_02090 [Harpegnathos saltator]
MSRIFLRKNTTPPAIRTNFSCFNRPMGFYADVEANCRVYHTCDDHGNKFSYRCPEETAFRQDALICDHAYLVDCQATVHPPNRFPTENTGNKNNAAPASRPSVSPIDSLDDHRLSFSRSFQVVQRPDKSVPNRLQSGFVFSASLFLRDRDRTRDRAAPRTADTSSRRCNVDSKDRFATASTVRTLTERFNSWDVRNDKSNRARPAQSLSLSETRSFARDKSATVNLRRSFEPTPSPLSFGRTIMPDNVTQRPAFPREKSIFLNDDHNYRPYSETLKSIQANAVRPIADSTTEIPVHALTLSLKPLVPNELEYDPYYPKQPTSTEAYYTPSNRNGFNANVRVPTSSQVPPAAISHLNLPFEIPPVLPDLNSLEDLVDRRKLFYIPRVSAKSI